MPDIFLSYSRDDQQTARRFAEGFERAGFSVWWDATLSPGEAYDEVTEKALQDARAVVVLWSKKSVASRWVRAEATQALRGNTLVPAMIEPCVRPIMFELTHTADLSQWSGDSSDKDWQSFLAGVRRMTGNTQPVPASATSIARSPGHRRLWPIVAAVAAVAVAVALGVVWESGSEGRAPAGPKAQMAATAPAEQVTLAVLPFVNLTSDPEQEYFSDGLTEEILNQLAQVRQLRVTGRTSSFSFKGKNEDLRVIGEKLGVANLLEGSVRKDGKQLRITAQLINAGDGTHLWSKTYARELADIFALQEEVAMDVATALSVTLDVGDMSRAKGGTTNIEAHDRYLQAQAHFHRGGLTEWSQATTDYLEALEIDPEFARAWYGLYYTQEQLAQLGQTPGPLMGEALAKMTALSPNAPWTKASQMSQFVQQRRWSEAEQVGSAAVASSPVPEILLRHGIFLKNVGRAREGLAFIQRAARAEPLSDYTSMTLQFALDEAGLKDAAQAEYERSREFAGGLRGIANHAALMRLWSRPGVDPAAIQRFVVDTFGKANILGGITPANWSNKAVAAAALRNTMKDSRFQNSATPGFAEHYGERELALAELRRLLIDLRRPWLFMLWAPYETDLRADPKFKQIVRELGLVDYWRASGKWSDFCTPVGQDDFECH